MEEKQMTLEEGYLLLSLLRQEYDAWVATKQADEQELWTLRYLILSLTQAVGDLMRATPMPAGWWQEWYKKQDVT